MRVQITEISINDAHYGSTYAVVGSEGKLIESHSGEDGWYKATIKLDKIRVPTYFYKVKYKEIKAKARHI